VFALYTTIGLSIFSATLIKSAPLVILSRYMHIIDVAGSLPKYSKKSTSSKFNLLPMLATLATPIFSSMITFHIVSITPPLCDIMDIPPNAGLSIGTKGRHNPFSTLATVKPFGPTNLIPYFCALATVCCASILPSSLYSENPPLGIAIHCTPF